MAFTLAIFSAKVAVAGPCVSETFDTPLEGAQNVVTRTADVPSPQFPGLWQEGELGGYFYALYSNGEGVLKASKKASAWKFEIACKDPSQTCAMRSEGAPPADAIALANVLAQCLTGQAEIKAQAPQTPCGLATVPEGPAAKVLQNLLIAAGVDPGPVDGFIGAKTQNALVEALGERANDLSLSDAITALDASLCSPQD